MQIMIVNRNVPDSPQKSENLQEALWPFFKDFQAE